MSKRLLIQLLLVLAGVFIAIVLWFSPRTPDEDTTAQDSIEEVSDPNHNEEGHTHEDIDPNADDTWSKSLESNPVLKKTLEEKGAYAEKIADVQARLDAYDSLIQLCIKENLPPYVALYTRKKAETVPTPINWMLAGDNYFKAFRLSKNSSEAMLNGAISAYEEVVKLDPNNLQAKTALGVAYVEGAAILGEMPMKGIGMLKEVLNIDPENVDALTNLGYFAIQSGQYEKAIERFDQVLTIDPRNAEAYLYLADVYLSQGQTEKGVGTLEKYRDLMNDPLVTQRVNQYIEEIRSN